MAMHNKHRMMRLRRADPSGSAASVSPATSATAIVDSAPPSSGIDSTVNLSVPNVTKTLEIVVAILCVIILLGVGICFFRRWKRISKRNAAPSHIIDFSSEKPRAYEADSKLDLHASAYILEKPSSVYMPGVSLADMNPGWVPQIAPNGNNKLASNASTSSKKSKGSKKSLRYSRGWDKTFSKFAPSERSPPPSYLANERKPATPTSVPLPPSPPHQSTLPPTPPTPPAKKAKNPFSRDIPPAKPEPTELPPVPVLSPTRSASFAAHQSMALASIQMDRFEETTKLAVVVNPFVPSMDDELSIQVGQTLRVLEEFQDGWALVQSVGRTDAPKGVVPQTCLAPRTLSPNRRL